jgi:hypothetical protein
MKQSAESWITLKRLLISWAAWKRGYRAVVFENARRDVFGDTWARVSLKRRVMRAWSVGQRARRDGESLIGGGDVKEESVIVSMGNLYDSFLELESSELICCGE